ncbi:hypothetical protein [Anaerocolumna sp. MB42-C2]|uniref:hypothetical protein n=1 Tax=Anaerocolumna sp. MB42-C2 TaxID=3070997 RepID=UPI0027DFA7E7|nr:hypothetical protein [Anaerocolumna sp. MB42-C2]WMJ88421.1 hypothetical protein RBU59_02605 [Anaerocolumna sp. MB42-C2]
MRDRYIAPAIMLVAGAVVSIFNIINGIDFLKGLERLLLVLILFYILGRIAARIIRKVTATEKEPDSIEENIPMEEEGITEETEENKDV